MIYFEKTICIKTREQLLHFTGHFTSSIFSPAIIDFLIYKLGIWVSIPGSRMVLQETLIPGLEVNSRDLYLLKIQYF